MQESRGAPLPLPDKEERPTVLVCDDEPNLRELIRVTLGEGYTVVEAGDGHEALELARRSPPDLVILDLMMPRGSGFEVLAELRRDARLASVPVVVVTAQPATADEAVAAGADHVLGKPFSSDELVELAANLTQR